MSRIVCICGSTRFLSEITQERKRLRAERDSLTATVQRLATERDTYAARLSEVLCDLTGGRLSKPDYDSQTMIQAIEEHLTATIAGGGDSRG